MSAPYWQTAGPYITRNEKSYSGDSDLIIQNAQTKWPHALSEILSAASIAGFRVIELLEYPFSHYRSVPEMIVGDDYYYHHPRCSESVPFLFSLKLIKER